MPNPGLSLVGFMTDPVIVLRHLREHCIPDPVAKTDADLLNDWAAATANIGEPVQNAGTPDIRDIPNEAQAHILQLLNAHWYSEAVKAWPVGMQLKLVEIDKLLAFQFTIDTARTDHHCNGMSNPPTLDEMLRVCLPIQPPPENLKVQVTPDLAVPGNANLPKAAIITSKGHNLRMGHQGVFSDPLNNPNSAGLLFGFGSPGAQVVRFNGRCYLHNGFHRALGLRRAGATHMPCILRDIATAEEIGMSPPWTFDVPLLTGPNPPTLEHFTQGRACSVQLRPLRTVIHVSWAVHVIPEE